MNKRKLTKNNSASARHDVSTHKIKEQIPWTRNDEKKFRQNETDLYQQKQQRQPIEKEEEPLLPLKLQYFKNLQHKQVYLQEKWLK